MATVFYPTQFQDNAAISLIEHYGVMITHQYDVRGPQHDGFYDLVTLEFDGEECTFNTVEDACSWINEQLDLGDVDPDHDPVREWGAVGR